MCVKKLGELVTPGCFPFLNFCEGAKLILNGGDVRYVRYVGVGAQVTPSQICGGKRRGDRRRLRVGRCSPSPLAILLATATALHMATLPTPTCVSQLNCAATSTASFVSGFYCCITTIISTTIHLVYVDVLSHFYMYACALYF